MRFNNAKSFSFVGQLKGIDDDDDDDVVVEDTEDKDASASVKRESSSKKDFKLRTISALRCELILI